MKTIPVSLIIGGLMGVLAAVAQAESDLKRCEHSQGDDKMPVRQPFVEAWKLADLDEDGGISRQEFDQMQRVEKLPAEKRAALFERLDKDRDGIIGRDEIQRIIKHHNRRDAGMPRIWELDENKDGGVSFEEFQQGPMFHKLDAQKQQKIFSRLDSDGDGKITPQDEPPRRPKRPRDGRHDGKPGERHGPGGMIERLDSNRDQELSFEEFKSGPRAHEVDAEVLRRRFDAMDRNGDGKLTHEDFKRAPKPPVERRSGKAGIQAD